MHGISMHCMRCSTMPTHELSIKWSERNNGQLDLQIWIPDERLSWHAFWKLNPKPKTVSESKVTVTLVKILENFPYVHVTKWSQVLQTGWQEHLEADGGQWPFTVTQISVHNYSIWHFVLSWIKTIFDNVETTKWSGLKAVQFCQLCI